MKKYFITIFLFSFFNLNPQGSVNVQDVFIDPDVDLTMQDFIEPSVFGVDEISNIPDDYQKQFYETQKAVAEVKQIKKDESVSVRPKVKIVPKKESVRNEREKYFNLPISKKTNGTKEISICSTIPKTGTSAVVGKQIFEGMNLAFNIVNKKGGVNGSIIKLYFYDDKSSFAIARDNVEKLQEKSPLFINLFGLSRMYAIEPELKKGRSFVLFPIVGSSIVRDKSDESIIYFRASEKKEIQKLIDYSVKKQNKKTISILYERSEWGQTAYEYAKNYLKGKYGLSITSEGSYSEKTVNVLNAVKSISQKVPNTILCIASSRATYNFIRRAINSGLYHCLFLGLSRLSVARHTLSQARGVNVVTSSVVPNPQKSKLLIAKQYRQDMKKYFPTKELNNFSFEGYINAQIFIQALKGIKQPITTSKIFKALQKLKKMKFRGLRLRFGSEPKTLSPDVWLEED